MVRIIGRFWDDVAAHQALINRCFNYINNKFPNPEGKEAAYSDLMAEMHRLNVFGEFDKKRQAKTYRGKNTNPDKTTEKKFEQYIFMRVHHILQAAYQNRYKHNQRYSGVPNIDGYNAETYGNINENEPSFCELTSDKPSRKKYPTIHNDIRDFVGAVTENVEEKMDGERFMDRLSKVLKNPIEKKVVEMRAQGLAQNEVAEVVGCTTQNVSFILKRIKDRAQLAGVFQ